MLILIRPTGETVGTPVTPHGLLIELLTVKHRLRLPKDLIYQLGVWLVYTEGAYLHRTPKEYIAKMGRSIGRQRIKLNL